MDKEFEFAANNWIDQYKADIRGKVENLLNENDSTPEELAETIDVDVDEIYDILEGNGEYISIETLIKVFMVLGFAVEIKPIEETPLGGYDNVNPMVMDEPMFERREPRQNPFMQPRAPMGGFGMPPHDFDPSRIPPHVRERVERDFEERRHPQFTRREEPKRSPFAIMGRNELVNIIRNKLWDSEIDVENAPKESLVRFLEEKDKRMQEVIRREKAAKNNEELERDPKVAAFVKNVKKNIKENPQFRSYMKQFLNKLDEE